MKVRMKVRIKCWLFVVMIISVPALKAENGNGLKMEHNKTFFDDNFVPDSALVLLNGAVNSAIIEAICLKTTALPANDQAVFCHYFAPEAITFIYLCKSQWPEYAIEIWSSMNMVLFGLAMAYVDQENRQNLPGLTRTAVMAMVYYQMMQIQTEALARYVTGSNQNFLPNYTYILFNGLSTGLITGGSALWLTYIHTMQYKPLVLLMVTPSATLMSVFFYILGSSETINAYELAQGIFAAVSIVIVAIIAGAGIETRDEVEAEALAIALVKTGAGIGAGSAIGTLAGAGALVGAVTVAITGCMAATLSLYSDTFSISNGVFITFSAGAPLMVSFWCVSWQRFVKSDIATHATMQNEFIFPLKFRSFFSANWIREFL